MSYFVICIAALVVSGLTLFSGFGLGTLLMPAFAIFFPVEVAVAATAIVHLSNNIFKAGLFGKKADFRIVIRFALPAAIFAAIGALLLSYMSTVQPINTYTLAGRICTVSIVKLIIAGMILIFAIIELVPGFEKLAFDPKFIPFGGAVSGFFGGLSGHQGALRTAFLIRTGLDKNSFIGTMVISAIVVDVSRLIIYGSTFFARDFQVLKSQGGIGLVVAGSLAAFLGAFLGSRLLGKITMRSIQIFVGVMLLLLSLALGFGLV
ncbi:MAG: sulfite exporter TauE/SafE family protein [Deltaproteobacteria bacterium]|nr:sulfite exporter TauE/SafE family protein [Deltaproteobacteria bacterium]